MNTLTIQDGVDSYLQSIRSTQMLTKEDEFMLATRFADHGDQTAGSKIILAHLPLAAKIARGYKKYGLPFGDLISEANIGLIHAMNKFAPEKGYRFSTYAMMWIKATVQEYILRSWSLVKIGTTSAQKKLFYGLEKTKKRLGIAKITNLNITKLVSVFGIPADTIYEMDSRIRGDASLNVHVSTPGGDGSELERQDLLIADVDHVSDIVDDDERSYQLSIIDKGLATMLPRYQEIIRRRHLTDDPASLKELAGEYGVSRERIRQIESSAIKKLKLFVAANS